MSNYIFVREDNRIQQSISVPDAIMVPAPTNGLRLIKVDELPPVTEHEWEYVDGQIRPYIEVPAPPTDEEKWQAIRTQRNRLLSVTDWRVTRAAEPGQPPLEQAWVDYRQALRDVTLQPDPDNIVWPSLPSA